jgi:hypothetical protein
MDEVTGFAAGANKGRHVAPFLGNLKSDRHGGIEWTAEHREEFRGNHGEGSDGDNKKPPARGGATGAMGRGVERASQAWRTWCQE